MFTLVQTFPVDVDPVVPSDFPALFSWSVVQPTALDSALLFAPRQFLTLGMALPDVSATPVWAVRGSQPYFAIPILAFLLVVLPLVSRIVMISILFFFLFLYLLLFLFYFMLFDLILFYFIFVLFCFLLLHSSIALSKSSLCEFFSFLRPSLN
jgi:hypothetical protein